VGPVSTRFSRRARPARKSGEGGLLARYNSLLVIGLAVAGVLVIGFFMFQAGARAGYECETLLTPGPEESVTPRPSPAASPSPGESPSPDASPAASPDASPAASPGASPAPGTSPSPGASPAASPGASPAPGTSPSPGASPAPDPTPRLGFTTSDLGRQHLRDPGQPLRYGFCPPTSGDHWAIANRAPLRPAVYPPTDEQSPGGWIHNLEHGFIVVAYRCTGPDDCPSDAEMAELQRFFDEAPAPRVSNCPSKALVVRFDEMSTRFAIMAWGRALLVDDFDLDTALTFAEQWMEHDAVPEPNAC
jgi:hypothetical protein